MTTDWLIGSLDNCLSWPYPNCALTIPRLRSMVEVRGWSPWFSIVVEGREVRGWSPWLKSVVEHRAWSLWLKYFNHDTQPRTSTRYSATILNHDTHQNHCCDYVNPVPCKWGLRLQIVMKIPFLAVRFIALSQLFIKIGFFARQSLSSGNKVDIDRQNWNTRLQSAGTRNDQWVLQVAKKSAVERRVSYWWCSNHT